MIHKMFEKTFDSRKLLINTVECNTMKNWLKRVKILNKKWPWFLSYK